MVKLLLNICLVMVTAAGETTEAAANSAVSNSANSMAVAYICKVTDYVGIVFTEICCALFVCLLSATDIVELTL